MTPQEWVDRHSGRFVEAWAALDISNDDFIRTTEPRHHLAVQQFLQTIHDNGFIELGRLRGLYCVACEDYKTESDLIDGNCARSTGPPVELLEEENYFFKLSAFEDRLLSGTRTTPTRCDRRRSATRRRASSRAASRTSRSPAPPHAGG